MHFEVALVGKQVLPVADGAVRLVRPRGGRLGTMMLVRSRCPFLARLEQLDNGEEIIQIWFKFRSPFQSLAVNLLIRFIFGSLGRYPVISADPACKSYRT